MAKMKFMFSRRDWAIILIGAPVLVFVLSMINVPFKWWLPGYMFLPEWLQSTTLIDLIFMSSDLIIIGALVGGLILILLALWRM